MSVVKTSFAVGRQFFKSGSKELQAYEDDYYRFEHPAWVASIHAYQAHMKLADEWKAKQLNKLETSYEKKKERAERCATKVEKREYKRLKNESE